jgi:tRNA A-37 threonylcarbamoyl transferase component Bud32
VIVKWSRPATVADRLARALRGGKGVREGRVIRHLAAAGLPVPEVLGCTDDGVDLLVVREVTGLEPLPADAEDRPGWEEQLGRCLGRAFRAGLRHPDLHRANLHVAGGDPVLVDLGRARIACAGGRVRELARLQSALAPGVRRSARLRFLLAWLAQADGAVPSRSGLRALVRRVDRRARRVRERYRRGRDRRATRTGRHFEAIVPAGGGRLMCRREAPEGWREDAVRWLDSDPPGAVALKPGGRVICFRPEGAGTDVVLKRFGPVAPGRLPRAIASFRRSAWLADRGIAAPRAWLAVSARDRSGLLLSEHLDAPDLHRFAAGGRGGDLAAMPRPLRRAAAAALGRFLRELHEAGLSHRDLKAPNLLVRAQPDGRVRFWITDLEGLRRHRGAPSPRRRAKDLARLDASLDATAADRVRALAAYLAPFPRLGVDRRTFATWIARHVRSKRGPSGLPR